MKERARQLRKSQTDAEKLLWRLLRNRQLCDCKFRRQHPIGPYIVDLVCQERWLILELDGGQHAIRARQDSERSAYLESRGFRVLRFWKLLSAA
ncbi:MAG: endonuclease domain-containing protein [Syntrophobacteraceae bacterium]